MERNRHRLRRHEGGAGGGGAGHTKAAPMLSIRTLENQRCRIILLQLLLVVSDVNTDTVPGSRSGELLYITAVDSPDRGPGLQQPPVIREEFKVNRDVY